LRIRRRAPVEAQRLQSCAAVYRLRRRADRHHCLNELGRRLVARLPRRGVVGQLRVVLRALLDEIRRGSAQRTCQRMQHHPPTPISGIACFLGAKALNLSANALDTCSACASAAAATESAAASRSVTSFAMNPPPGCTVNAFGGIAIQPPSAHFARAFRRYAPP